MKKRKETISNTGRSNWVRDDKKYRYYFFDYLYYRLYLIYKKHNETPRFFADYEFTCNISLFQYNFQLRTDRSLVFIEKLHCLSRAVYKSWIGGNVLYHVVFTIYP